MAAPFATVGRYALRHEIASGGMAVVHLGRLIGPAGFSRTVAIKRLHPHLARNPEFVAMFLDEARLAARIRHPNVVSTLDVVATEGELFVVMEYVPGDSLARVLRAASERGERVPLPVAASVMVNVLHGLHAAHEACDEQGQPLMLVHRDVSPHNVLVGTDGAAHVIDFGVAKAVGRAQVTREGQLKGKLAYMAPEQLKGGRVDRRADVFGAAVVFWEMLTGERLFDGADEGEIYGKVVRGEVRRPSKIVGGVTRKTDSIVLRGLARSTSRRYESARAMALAIEEALPLATPSQLGQWVERLTADVLAERRRQIAEIERDDDRADSATAIRIARAKDPAVNIPTGADVRLRMDDVSLTGTYSEGRPPAEAMFTDTSLVASEPAPRRRHGPRGSLVGAAGVAVVALAVAGSVALLRRDASSRSPSVDTAATMTSPPPSGVASAPVSVPPAASSAIPRDAPSELPLSPVLSPGDLPLAPNPTPAAHPAFRHAPRAETPSCTPPYTVDANGYKKYKRECATW
jgi:eukaryotic-like serine/threonine-protein kinase